MSPPFDRTPNASPRFNLVLPAHNRSQWCSQARAGDLNQRYQDLEAVVVDEASDPAFGPRHRRRECPRIVLLRGDRRRSRAARKAIDSACAGRRVLANFDDGDLLDLVHVDSAAGALSCNPHVDVVYIGVAQVRPSRSEQRLRSRFHLG